MGIVGAVTLLLAGFAALVQTDIKRVLAYSTMSQIGYMFGAGRAGMGRGDLPPDDPRVLQGAAVPVVRFGDHGLPPRAKHLQDGRPAQEHPAGVRLLLVGGAALSALPLVTAGFFSKDEITAGAMANGHINLMVAGWSVRS